MSASLLILAVPALYVLGAVVIAFLLYLVIRKGVRDGMLDARELDRQQTAERRSRETYEAGTHPAPGPGSGV